MRNWRHEKCGRESVLLGREPSQRKEKCRHGAHSVDQVVVPLVCQRHCALLRGRLWRPSIRPKVNNLVELATRDWPRSFRAGLLFDWHKVCRQEDYAAFSMFIGRILDQGPCLHRIWVVQHAQLIYYMTDVHISDHKRSLVSIDQLWF